MVINEIARKKMEAQEKRDRKLYAHLYEVPKKRAVIPVEDEELEEEPKERKPIKVDLRKDFYKRKNLNKYEIEYLVTQEYKEFKYRSICTGKVENYLLRPRFNESLNHMIVIYDLHEYLKKKKIVSEKYTTRMPDIVLYFGKKKIAIEVETGTVIKNMKKFNEKLRLLKENYGCDFYFIVTNRNLIKKYRKYGKVIDPRYIKGQIDKIIKNLKNC